MISRPSLQRSSQSEPAVRPALAAPRGGAHGATADSRRSLIVRYWDGLATAIVVAGVGTWLAVAAIDPVFAERYLSGDGQLADSLRRLLRMLQIVLAVAGVALVWLGRRTRGYTPAKERVALGAVLGLLSLVVSGVMLEAGLRAVHHFVRPIQTNRHYFFMHDPLLGWKHRPDAMATFKGHAVRIDGDGLRRHRSQAGGGPEALKLLFLGDSQVFGDGVAAEETFVALLEQSLAGTQTMNAAVIGYGTDQQLLYFERDGLRHRPDAIIVGLNAYDLNDNISTEVRSGYRKPMFALAGDGLLLTNVPVDPGSPVERTRRWLDRTSHVYATATRLRTGRERPEADEAAAARADATIVFPAPSQLPEALEVTRRLLARLNRAARDGGSRMAVAFLPYAMDFEDEATYREQSDRLAASLQAWGVEEGFPVLDLRQALAGSDPADLFLDTMHFSAEGHRRAAAATRAWLERSGVVSRTFAGDATW